MIDIQQTLKKQKKAFISELKKRLKRLLEKKSGYYHPQDIEELNSIVESASKYLFLKEPLKSKDAYDRKVYSLMDWYNDHKGLLDFKEDAINEIIELSNQVIKDVEAVQLKDTYLMTTEELDQKSLDDLDSEEHLKTFIGLRGLKLYFLGNITLNEAKNFKNQLFKALSYLEKSPFKKVILNSYVITGDNDNLQARGISIQDEETIASYRQYDDEIIYFLSHLDDKDAFVTLIHEYGHRYHYKLIKGGDKNQGIIDLYNRAMQASEQCYLDHLPKIGDPLSNLREDWWTVRTSSDDYVLEGIYGETYLYSHPKKGHLPIDKKDILKRITCPSKYSAKNQREFFAEIFTLIVLKLVKPSQKVLVDKFMEIVNQESL